VARATASPMSRLVVTDSIQATDAVNQSDTVQQLSIAPLMAEAIRRIEDDSSISNLFD